MGRWAPPQIAKKTLYFLVLTALLVWAGSVPAAYAQILVTTTLDELDGGMPNGSCSLREAISNANSDTAGQADCGVGADTIILEAGQTYTLSIGGTGEDSNATGDLDITDTDGLTIETNLTFGTATINAANIDRVIEMHAGPLTLIDPSIEDGTHGCSIG